MISQISSTSNKSMIFGDVRCNGMMGDIYENMPHTYLVPKIRAEWMP